jgi:hypothetical protein
VVAGVRTSSKAEAVFGQLGVSEGYQQSGAGILFVEEGVDVTNPETLGADLFRGVTQVGGLLGPLLGQGAPLLPARRRCPRAAAAAAAAAARAPLLTRGPAAGAQVVTCLGGVFGPLPEGGMGYIDGMSPERVEAQGGPRRALLGRPPGCPGPPRPSLAPAAACMCCPAPAQPARPRRRPDPPARRSACLLAGLANVAAAMKAHVALQAPEEAEFLGMRSEADMAKWDKLDDVIMGGQSSSGLVVSDGTGAQRRRRRRPTGCCLARWPGCACVSGRAGGPGGAGAGAAPAPDPRSPRRPAAQARCGAAS